MGANIIMSPRGLPHFNSILKIPAMKIVEFTNCVDSDEVTHNEASQLDLYYHISSVIRQSFILQKQSPKSISVL